MHIDVVIPVYLNVIIELKKCKEKKKQMVMKLLLFVRFDFEKPVSLSCIIESSLSLCNWGGGSIESIVVTVSLSCDDEKP